MGAPPPPNYPPPDGPDVGSSTLGASADFGIEASSAPTATICGFGIGLPKLKFGLSIFVDIHFPPAIPLPWFTFTLQCDPSDPIDVTGGIGPGGGRPETGEPDPDDDEDSA